MDDHLTLGLATRHCHLFNEKGQAFKRLIGAAAETQPIINGADPTVDRLSQLRPFMDTL